jgi:hypothetical protein
MIGNSTSSIPPAAATPEHRGGAERVRTRTATDRQSRRGRRRALRAVEQEHDRAGLPAEHADHVARTGVPRSLAGDVDAARPGNEQRARERAREVRERQQQHDGQHALAIIAPASVALVTAR